MHLPNCTHYDIRLSIKPEPMHPLHKFYGGTIEVDCTATIENQSSGPITTVPFLLYRLLSVEQVGDATGARLAFTQEVVALQDSPRQQANVIQVFLEHPLPTGQSTQVRLIYSGPVCGYPEVWPYVQDHISEQYTLLRRDVLWFPVVSSSTGDIWEGAFTFDLCVTVPKGNLVAVANGQTYEVNEQSDSVCYGWHTTQPEKFPRLTVACAPYRYMNIAPDIGLYYLPDDENGAQVVAKAMNRTRALCMTWFGPLPSHGLNIVEIPGGWGSEASRNLVLQTQTSFQAATLDDEQAYRRALSFAGHEMIHLWGVPSLERPVSRFLDEGITHYIEALLLKASLGEDTYWERLAAYRQSFLAAGDGATAVSLADAGHYMKIRDVISRGKVPWLMCVLHHLVGDRLFEALRVFFDRYRDNGATLEDFQATVTEVSQLDLNDFFQDWLWGAESAKYLAKDLSGIQLIASLVEMYHPNSQP